MVLSWLKGYKTFRRELSRPAGCRASVPNNSLACLDLSRRSQGKLWCVRSPSPWILGMGELGVEGGSGWSAQEQSSNAVIAKKIIAEKAIASFIWMYRLRWQFLLILP